MKTEKQKVSIFVAPEIAHAIAIQAARMGVSKSECIRLMMFEPKKAEALQYGGSKNESTKGH
jgi:hypothetical protein